MGFSSLLYFALSCVLGCFGYIFPPKQPLIRPAIGMPPSARRCRHTWSLLVKAASVASTSSGRAYIQGTFLHQRRSGDVKWCFFCFSRFNLSLFVLREAGCFERCLVISGVFKGAGISQISGIVRKHKGIHHPQDTHLLDKRRMRKRNQQIHSWKMCLRQQDAVLTSLH